MCCLWLQISKTICKVANNIKNRSHDLTPDNVYIPEIMAYPGEYILPAIQNVVEDGVASPRMQYSLRMVHLPPQAFYILDGPGDRTGQNGPQPHSSIRVGYGLRVLIPAGPDVSYQNWRRGMGIPRHVAYTCDIGFKTSPLHLDLAR